MGLFQYISSTDYGILVCSCSVFNKQFSADFFPIRKMQKMNFFCQASRRLYTVYPLAHACKYTNAAGPLNKYTMKVRSLDLQFSVEGKAQYLAHQIMTVIINRRQRENCFLKKTPSLWLCAPLVTSLCSVSYPLCAPLVTLFVLRYSHTLCAPLGTLFVLR